MTITLQQMDRLIDFLELKTRRDGHFQTSWGHKTLEGLRESIENILSDKDLYIRGNEVKA